MLVAQEVVALGVIIVLFQLQFFVSTPVYIIVSLKVSNLCNYIYSAYVPYTHNVKMYTVVYILCPENRFKLSYFFNIVGMW